jgi:hypothetical protein
MRILGYFGISKPNPIVSIEMLEAVRLDREMSDTRHLDFAKKYVKFCLKRDHLRDLRPIDGAGFMQRVINKFKSLKALRAYCRRIKHEPVIETPSRPRRIAREVRPRRERENRDEYRRFEPFENRNVHRHNNGGLRCLNCPNSASLRCARRMCRPHCHGPCQYHRH